MKNLMMAVAVLMIASSASADAKDLKIFNALTQKVGVSTEAGMSKIYVSLEILNCKQSHHVNYAECTFIDIGANDGEGANVKVTGRKAKLIIAALRALNAPSDGAMGSSYIGANALRCKQVVAGVYEPELPASERTDCWIEVETEENEEI